ncbi:heparinase II/III domain-containing protein [Ornithinibacillus californiensis]|uniref:heparinase II/III domain-containing protein n=1 Tax=Ornithinibacillus californiensis TaxID=161536 RepID=UPI00069FD5FE|nr:heparinase II/III family protein [Ornithinibacillus californiensis]
MNFSKMIHSISDHPRILYNPNEIEELHEKITKIKTVGSVDYQKFENMLYSLANEYTVEKNFQVNYPVINFTLHVELPLIQLEDLPEPVGYIDFPYWTMYSRAIEERIKTLAVAFGLSQQKKYADKIREYLLALSKFSRWYEFPHRGAEGNLSNAHLLIAVAVGYDAIFHFLTEDEKKEIRIAIIEKGLRPFEIDFDNHDSHNIIASKRIAMLIGALTVIDEADVETYFLNAYHYIWAYLNERLDSPEIEGLLYTKVAANHLLMAVDILYRATGNKELMEHPYFDTYLPNLFISMLGISDEKTASFVNFSDSFYELDVTLMMSYLASNNKHPVASWYNEQFSSGSTDIMSYIKSAVSPKSPEAYYQDVKSMVFPHIGWASLRSSWDKSGHLLAFTASRSAKDHNHFDQNNFVLFKAGEWLLTNPGYQDYVEGPKREFTLGTIGHNAMLINGVGQAYRGNSTIKSWIVSPYLDVLVGDATNTYQAEIRRWERYIFHIDQTYFIMMDDVEKEKQKDQLTFLYHTNAKIYTDGKIRKQGEEFNHNQINMTGEKAEVHLYTIYPEMTKKRVDCYKGAEQYGNYLTIKPDIGNVEDKMITLLYPTAYGRGNGSTLDYEIIRTDSQIEFKITRKQENVIDYIVINKEENQAKSSDSNDLIQTNGEIGWVSIQQENTIPRAFSLINGNVLTFKGKLLVRSDKKANFIWKMNSKQIDIRIELVEDCMLTFFSNDPKTCTINQKMITNLASFYNSHQNTTTVSLKQGKYDIVIESKI